jgi:hypothetical protein
VTRATARLEFALVALLALRLLAWVFLLPPWAGFDEPYHHSSVLDSARRLAWPRFRAVTLDRTLVDETRRWPVPPEYARLTPAETNYETQQSPLYYWASGLLLRLLPATSPVVSLYLLRILNAVLALLAGLVVLGAARRLLAGQAWLPIAFLALTPGLGLALTRVSNDALATLLMSLAAAAVLESTSPRFVIWGALAGGLAPWAKLYGVAVVPVNLARSLAAGGRKRALEVALLLGPPLLLAFLSWRLHGHIFPLQENLRVQHAAPLTEVPWLRDLWTIAKTHVFVSGMPVRVFPKWPYLVALALLAAGVGRTLRQILRHGTGQDRLNLAWLAAPLLLFGASLLYHSWRNYSFFHGPGGTGGWYLWAVLLPESLLVTWGLARKPPPVLAFRAILAFFLVLTIVGDAVLFIGPTGCLLTAGQEVVGIQWPSRPIWGLFFASRPQAAALAAVLGAVASWLLAGAILRRLRGKVGETPSSSTPADRIPADP